MTHNTSSAQATSDLAGIDALIEAAADSVAPRSRLDFASDSYSEVSASALRVRDRARADQSQEMSANEIAAAAIAAVEAALDTADFVADPPPSLHETAPPQSSHGHEGEASLDADNALAETTANQKDGETQPDLVDGALRRVEATLSFADGHPDYTYERRATTNVLREAAATIRLLREKRDQSRVQMERWFNQRRAAEATMLDLEGQLKRLTEQHEYLSGVLQMARSFCIQERIHVEWRAHNAWVVRYDSFLLTRNGKWEPEQAEPDPEHRARTRYALSDAITKARAVRLEGAAR